MIRSRQLRLDVIPYIVQADTCPRLKTSNILLSCVLLEQAKQDNYVFETSPIMYTSHIVSVHNRVLKKITGFIERIATIRVLVLLTLLSILFPVFLFPAAGIGGDTPLDLYLFYSPDQVNEYLGGLGAKGRSAYAKTELTTDLLFPVIYSMALMVALVMAARRSLPADSRLQYLRFLPLLIVIADWGENLCLAVVTEAFPDRLDAIVTAASFFTSLKWGFLVIVVMTLVILLALAVRKQFHKRQCDQNGIISGEKIDG